MPFGLRAEADFLSMKNGCFPRRVRPRSGACQVKLGHSGYRAGSMPTKSPGQGGLVGKAHLPLLSVTSPGLGPRRHHRAHDVAVPVWPRESSAGSCTDFGLVIRFIPSFFPPDLRCLRKPFRPPGRCRSPSTGSRQPASSAGGYRPSTGIRRLRREACPAASPQRPDFLENAVHLASPMLFRCPWHPVRNRYTDMPMSPQD